MKWLEVAKFVALGLNTPTSTPLAVGERAVWPEPNTEDRAFGPRFSAEIIHGVRCLAGGMHSPLLN